MKHENHEWQLVNLDLAIQLKAAGYKQEGIWWHVPSKSGKADYISQCEGWVYRSTLIVAPTVAEGLEKLPAEITVNNYVCILYINKNRNGYAVYYSSYNGKEGFSENDKTLSDAVHKMWLYLKKEDKL